jgi:predicted transposase YbfD/YdcC
VGQIFELERVRNSGPKKEVEVVYGMTSLSREQADAQALLEFIRGHWGIENRLHYVKDETLGEDRCRVRTGSSPEILSLLRNVVVHLLEEVEAPSKAAAPRRFMIHPHEAFPLLLT